MAIAARYWMKTTGAVLLSSIGCFMVVEKIRQPGGDTHTFEPLPRPAIWVVAVQVNPGGILESNFAFLDRLACLAILSCKTYFSSRVLVLVRTSP